MPRLLKQEASLAKGRWINAEGGGGRILSQESPHR